GAGGDGWGDGEVVGGENQSEPGGLHELSQRGEHVLGGARVEVSGGLVGKENARCIGDGARDRDALLLASRKLSRPVFEAFLQTKIAEQVAGAARGFSTR